MTCTCTPVFEFELILGSKFIATLQIKDSTGAAMNLTGVTITAVAMSAMGATIALFDVVQADQNTSPGVIQLQATPGTSVSQGTYNRSIASGNYNYSVLMSLPSGDRFPFPPQRLKVHQSAQNLIAIG